MAFFLRTDQRVIPLPAGTHVVGRSSMADIVLQDTLVSRRHCLLHVGSDGVSLEDLESRNGLLLNGRPVPSETSLAVGDRISIGRMVLVFQSGPAPEPEPPPVEDRQTLPDQGETATGTAYDMFVESAQQALRDGDLEAAENIAGNLFVSVRAALVRGRGVRETPFDATINMGLELAKRTGQRRWVEKVFILYVASGTPVSTDVLERVRGLGLASVEVDALIHHYANAQ